MNPYRNPLAPGAGCRQPELAGRDVVLEQARVSCGRAINGRSARSMMLLGLRGTGKTVLLSEVGKIAEKAGLLVSKVESPEEESFYKSGRPRRGTVPRGQRYRWMMSFNPTRKPWRCWMQVSSGCVSTS